MKRRASRLLSTLLALCMVLALLPGTVFAEEEANDSTTGTNGAPPELNVPTDPDNLKKLADQMGILKYVDFDTLDDTGVTKLKMAELLAGMPGIEFVSSDSCSFTDCRDLTPNQKGIINATNEYGILRGYSEKNLGPNDLITRAQGAAIIHRYLDRMWDVPDVELLPEFSDVKEETWYYYSIAVLYNCGIIKSGSEYFDPDRTATRLDVVEWFCGAVIYLGGIDIGSVTGVSLNKNSLKLSVGDVEYLTAYVKPIAAGNTALTWTSSNEQVATVSQTGKVTAVAAGTATITVSTQDGGFTAACTVTVVGRVQNEYRINSVTLRDSDGEELRQIPAGSFWACVSVTNLSSQGGACVLLASYDADGKYLDMMCGQFKSLPTGTEAEWSFLMKNTDGKTANVKAFLISSLADFAPIGEAVIWR